MSSEHTSYPDGSRAAEFERKSEQLDKQVREKIDGLSKLGEQLRGKALHAHAAWCASHYASTAEPHTLKPCNCGAQPSAEAWNELLMHARDLVECWEAGELTDAGSTFRRLKTLLGQETHS